MEAAPRFLSALGHALDLRLRRGDTVVRFTSEDTLTSRAFELIEENPRPVFSFTEAGVRYGSLPLAGFEEWPWTRALAARGIARLELVAPPTSAAFAVFLDLASGLIPAEAPIPRDAIRWSAMDADLPAANDDYPLDEALSVVRQLFRSARGGEHLRRGDIAAVVAALNCVLAGEHGLPLPLLLVASREGYQPAHALNTALLAMRVADAMHLGPDERRECGVTALLHLKASAPRTAPGCGGIRSRARESCFVRVGRWKAPRWCPMNTTCGRMVPGIPDSTIPASPIFSAGLWRWSMPSMPCSPRALIARGLPPPPRCGRSDVRR
jgi:hypothetical protein